MVKRRISPLWFSPLKQVIPWMECDILRYSEDLIQRDINYIFGQMSLLGDLLRSVMEGRLGNLIEELQRRKEPKKRKWKDYRKTYPIEFYALTLRDDIRNRQDGSCLLKDDNCKGAMTFHHIDRNKTNNHVDNLAYMCTKHHFGIHNNKYTL